MSVVGRQNDVLTQTGPNTAMGKLFAAIGYRHCLPVSYPVLTAHPSGSSCCLSL